MVMSASRSFKLGWCRAGAIALLTAAASFAGCNDIFNGKTCAAGGRLYLPGDAIVESNGCNNCSCGANGELICVTSACISNSDCAFDTTYTYGYDGGLVGFRDLVTLTPAAGFSLQRTSYIAEPADAQCVPALPACHDPAQLDAGDIIAGLRDPEVQAALGMSAPPFYGHDSRPSDGVAFKLQRSDGRGLLVGDTCWNDEPCTRAPAGVQKLVDVLKALQAQQLLDPSCAGLPPAR
jgi:hypothetical protein